MGNVFEAISLIGFVVATFAMVFVVLWWALGLPPEAPTQPVDDKGAMTASGVPYVVGPERTE